MPSKIKGRITRLERLNFVSVTGERDHGKRDEFVEDAEESQDALASRFGVHCHQDPMGVGVASAFICQISSKQCAIAKVAHTHGQFECAQHFHREEKHRSAATMMSARSGGSPGTCLRSSTVIASSEVTCTRNSSSDSDA